MINNCLIISLDYATLRRRIMGIIKEMQLEIEELGYDEEDHYWIAYTDEVGFKEKQEKPLGTPGP
tara:strand:- start:396 stop:590 length:195 start_codon:yes stop_codon:yes gene_type:complete